MDLGKYVHFIQQQQPKKKKKMNKKKAISFFFLWYTTSQIYEKLHNTCVIQSAKFTYKLIQVQKLILKKV